MRDDFAAIVLNAEIPVRPDYLVGVIDKAQHWLDGFGPAEPDEAAELFRLCEIRDARAVALAEAEPAEDPDDDSDLQGGDN